MFNTNLSLFFGATFSVDCIILMTKPFCLSGGWLSSLHLAKFFLGLLIVLLVFVSFVSSLKKIRKPRS